MRHARTANEAQVLLSTIPAVTTLGSRPNHSDLRSCATVFRLDSQAAHSSPEGALIQLFGGRLRRTSHAVAPQSSGMLIGEIGATSVFEQIVARVALV